MADENTLIEVSKNQVSISDEFGYSPAEVAVIQKSVAKGTTGIELAYFINVCKTVGLNPFIKEIWCYKDNKGNLLVFAGRDGFLSKAQTNPKFNGIRSSEVCTNDEFSLDIANNVIKHVQNGKDRGEIIGAYAIAFRKDGEPTIEYVDFETYNKKFNAWKSHPAEMIKKVAETHCLKKAFGISGIQSEYDFEVKGQTAIPINSVGKPDELTELKRAIVQELSEYKGEDKETVRMSLQMAEEQNEFTVEFGTKILEGLRNGK